MKALLDTDILSEVLKAKDPNVVARARAYLEQHDQFTFSAVTVMEIVTGLLRAGRTRMLEQVMSLFHVSDILPLDDIAGELAGRIQADLFTRGTVIGIPDTMNAAIAVRTGLVLVTGNASDYVHVRDAGYPIVLDTWR